MTQSSAEDPLFVHDALWDIPDNTLITILPGSDTGPNMRLLYTDGDQESSTPQELTLSDLAHLNKIDEHLKEVELPGTSGGALRALRAAQPSESARNLANGFFDYYDEQHGNPRSQFLAAAQLIIGQRTSPEPHAVLQLTNTETHDSVVQSLDIAALAVQNPDTLQERRVISQIAPGEFNAERKVWFKVEPLLIARLGALGIIPGDTLAQVGNCHFMADELITYGLPGIDAHPLSSMWWIQTDDSSRYGFHPGLETADKPAMFRKRQAWLDTLIRQKRDLLKVPGSNTPRQEYILPVSLQKLEPFNVSFNSLRQIIEGRRQKLRLIKADDQFSLEVLDSNDEIADELGIDENLRVLVEIALRTVREQR